MSKLVQAWEGSRAGTAGQPTQAPREGWRPAPVLLAAGHQPTSLTTVTGSEQARARDVPGSRAPLQAAARWGAEQDGASRALPQTGS